MVDFILIVESKILSTLYRAVGAGGRRSHAPYPQILANQFNLSQPEGADYAQHITTPYFQIFLRP